MPVKGQIYITEHRKHYLTDESATAARCSPTIIATLVFIHLLLIDGMHSSSGITIKKIKIKLDTPVGGLYPLPTPK